MAQRVLVVEDETHLADGLRFNLEAEGYEVELAETGEGALDRLLKQRVSFDVMVLDLMLPGIDGFEVMEQLRQARHYIPALILTARGQASDVLRGFAAGADDYLTKPFELAILIARIRGLLRRSLWTAPASTERGTFRFGAASEKEADFDSLELRVNGEHHRLTLMEMNLLRYLTEHEGVIVSRKNMLAEVWDLHENTDTRAIDNFIVRLRRYIEDDPASPRHLLTVRGVGYRFVAAPR